MLWKSIKVAPTLKKSSLNPIIVAKTSPQPAICKLYVLHLFFSHSGKMKLNLLVCGWHSFQVSKFNSMEFIFAMSWHGSSKNDHTVFKVQCYCKKQAKEKSNITSALAYLQHFDQLSV